jgi:metal-sulfur cluster biosynthetic enzyme
VVTAAALDPESVLTALESVDDPHVPVSLRRMGMVAGVEVRSGGHVRVRVRIPCLACPGLAMIRDGIRDAAAALPGVTSVEVVEAWDEPWDRGMVEDRTRELMRRNGIQV